MPPSLRDGWKTAPPEAAGMDRRALQAMTETIVRHPDWNIHAVLIERDGRLVYEEYFAGNDERWGQRLGRVVFSRETKHDLRSATKSVTSALVGIALASGKLRSLDQSLIEFFPEYADSGRPEVAPLTLRHALTMSAGLDWHELGRLPDQPNDEGVMNDSPDPIGYVLTRPRIAEPGTVWRYSGGFSQVLATIVQRTTGEPLRDYARKVLFEPLGISDFEWLGNLASVPSAASGLRLRPRDLAKFGSLYLHEGRWDGRQVIPREWVRESTRWRFPALKPANAPGTRGYGYQWWHNCYRTVVGMLEVPSANGNGEQRIFVVPELHLVVTILAGRYNDPTSAGLSDRLLLEHIIPAVQGPRVAPRAAGRCAE